MTLVHATHGTASTTVLPLYLTEQVAMILERFVELADVGMIQDLHDLNLLYPKRHGTRACSLPFVLGAAAHTWPS